MTKICIDPGHGGSDPGACNGQYQEKTYALGMALRLGEELAKKGYEVLYTRRSDSYISLSGRSQTANNGEADLFISIHLNSAATIQANGIETLCYSKSGESGKLAKAVQAKLISATGAVDRGVKERTDLAVLKGTKMPAILVETGFISNYTEMKKLITVDYQEKIVGAIVTGVEEYLGVKTPEVVKTTLLESANDITWELNNTYFPIDDMTGFVKVLEEAKEKSSPLYWGYYKLVNRIK